MNQEIPTGQVPDAPGQGFEQIDADAVCEQCGTVNDEGTLLCKVCGQNLRDQRARRLTHAQGPDIYEERVSRVRLLTGVLSASGIILIVLVALNLPKIEAYVAHRLSEDSRFEEGGLWSGPESDIFTGLLDDLEEYPTSRASVARSLEIPVNEQSYNGRYVLLPPGRLQASRVIGEANLSRRGQRIYFVAKLRRGDIQIRGYAVLEEVTDGGERRPVVRSTSGFQIDGITYTGIGFADTLETGGHRVVASSDYQGSGTNHEVLAFRVR